MTSYEIAKVRPYKDRFIEEFYFQADSYSKYYERTKVRDALFEANWNAYGENAPVIAYDVYGLEQVREHLAELIASGKYKPEELKIIEITRTYIP